MAPKKKFSKNDPNLQLTAEKFGNYITEVWKKIQKGENMVNLLFLMKSFDEFHNFNFFFPTGSR
jgi:hypothetical protein